MAFTTMRPWFAGAAIAVTIAGTAYAQDAKAVFEARYAEMAAAQQAHDMDKFHAMLAPGYVMTDIQGNEHTADEIRGMMGPRGGGARPGGPGAPAAPAADGKPQSAPAAPAAPPAPRPVPKITVVSAAITGSTAQVEQQLEIHTERTGPDGKPGKVDITVLTDDTWVQSGGTWLLKTSDQKDVSVSRDGEVVFHQAK